MSSRIPPPTNRVHQIARHATLFLRYLQVRKLLNSIVVELADGYDEGGFAQAESIHAYLNRMETIGSLRNTRGTYYKEQKHCKPN